MFTIILKLYLKPQRTVGRFKIHHLTVQSHFKSRLYCWYHSTFCRCLVLWILHSPYSAFSCLIEFMQPENVRVPQKDWSVEYMQQLPLKCAHGLGLTCWLHPSIAAAFISQAPLTTKSPASYYMRCVWHPGTWKHFIIHNPAIYKELYYFVNQC